MPFCVGEGVDTASEFVSIARLGIGNYPCINLWFKEWTLDTPVKFGFAWIGVFFLGISTHGLAYLRLKAHHTIKRPSWKANFVAVSLFAVQTVLGYFLMLAAMSLTAELFCAVCGGLTVGYALLNLQLLIHPFPDTSTKNGSSSC